MSSGRPFSSSGGEIAAEVAASRELPLLPLPGIRVPRSLRPIPAGLACRT